VAAWLVIGVHALLAVATFQQYGITYDETWYSNYGGFVVDWYQSGFTDQNAFTYWTLPYAGAFYTVFVRAIAKLLPFGVFETGHLVGGLVGALGTFFAWRISSRLGGPRAGFFAALFMVTMPRWYGEFANPADLPMAVMAVATLDGLVRLADHLPRPGLARLAAVGVPLGLSLAVRFGSVFLVGYTGLLLFGWLVVRHVQRHGSNGWTAVRADAGVAARQFVAIAAIAWISMLPWWPKAIVSPTWPIESFLYTTQEFGYEIPTLFEGIRYTNQTLPWYYVIKWFAVVVPEHLIAGLALAVVAGLAWIVGARRPGSNAISTRTLGVALVAFAAVFPLSYTTVQHVIDYDGIRHFLFVVPPLAVLAALGIDAALGWLRTPMLRAVAATAIVAPGVLVVADMVRLHPYQYIYFNRVVAGGLPGAFGRYETEYWGASYKEGVEWLVAHYQRPELDRRIRVVSNSFSTSTEHYLPTDRFEYLGSYHNGGQVKADAPPPDVFLSILRTNAHLRHTGRILHTVERMGVPLLYVIEVEQP